MASIKDMFAKQNGHQVQAQSIRVRQQQPQNLTRTDSSKTYKPVPTAGAAVTRTESTINIAPSTRTSSIERMPNQAFSRNGYESIDNKNVHTYIYEIGTFCRRKECISSNSLTSAFIFAPITAL